MAPERREPVDRSTDGGPRARLSQLVDAWLAHPGAAYRALAAAAALVLLCVTAGPLYYLAVVALAEPDRLTVGVVPATVDLSAFVTVLEGPFFHYLFNSLVFAGATTAVVSLLAVLPAYAFGRLEFTGRRPLLFVVLLLGFFPPATLFPGLFRLFNQQVTLFGVVALPVDIYGTPAAVVAPLSVVAFPLALFVMTVFFARIPDGLEDAARVEGATRLGALFRVIIPLSAPGVATAAVLTFITAYVEYFFTFLMSGPDSSARGWAPVAAYLSEQAGGLSPRVAAAASILAVVPVVALVILAREWVISGLTQGTLRD